MKTIVVFVTTLDGKITRWGDPHVMRWSSKEDQAYFKQTWKDHKLIIMGSSTFDFDPLKPKPENRVVILTRDPTKYTKYVVPGQLEFSSETPAALSDRFRKEGYAEMLVVGGAHVATSFFREELVDELWLTLEPKIFGKGGNLVVEEELDVTLKMLSFEKVNEQGTVLTKYAVIKR
jgi:dihydrofolate reductase